MKKTKKLKNFDKKEQVRRKEEKGITLIALVITIIVLLILAGVSIATLTGENGILTKANKAREETETASEEEQRELAIIEANMSDKEITFQGVKIPAGFAPTKIEGESTVDEGLVIVDGEGNSYVWIEVPKDIYNDEQYTTSNKTNRTEAPTSSNDYTNIEKVLQNYASDYRDESNYSDTYYEGCGISSKNEYNSLKNKMLKSVYENGGFWIGQYEMGTNEIRTKESKERLTKAVCQEGTYPYNYVTVSQAQELARNINSGNYDSSLMFGIQWDLMLKFLEVQGAKKENELKEDSSTWGNYQKANFTITHGKYSDQSKESFNVATKEKPYVKLALDEGGILLTTGATKRNSVLNIYDIGGNVNEWTLEKYLNDKLKPCVARGGACVDDGKGANVSIRWGTVLDFEWAVIMGSRSSLY